MAAMAVSSPAMPLVETEAQAQRGQTGPATSTRFTLWLQAEAAAAQRRRLSVIREGPASWEDRVAAVEVRG